MEFFLFVTVFVLLNTQGTARPTDANPNSGITLRLPTTIEPGHVITLSGVLNEQSENFAVILQSANSKNCKIVYNYKHRTMEVIPGVEGYNKANNYEITDKSGTFTLELTARLNKSNMAEVNVTFNVNGVDLSEPLYLAVENLESLNSIIMEEGVKTINTLSFNLTKRT